MSEIRLYTIGFTRKSAEEFFTTLTRAEVRLLMDIRLNNVSRSAGFAKKAEYLRDALGNVTLWQL